MKRIHVLGGSGSGTSTLARALAEAMGAAHFDTDDFYWLPTSPRFRHKRPVDERLSLLATALDAAPAWTLSGSLCGWGDPLAPRFELVVYLDVPGEVRLARLRAREEQRNGAAAIGPGGDLHAEHVAFLDWAARYDDPDFTGRSRTTHRRWLATAVACRVLPLDGTAPTAALVGRVLEPA